MKTPYKGKSSINIVKIFFISMKMLSLGLPQLDSTDGCTGLYQGRGLHKEGNIQPYIDNIFH